MKTNSLLARLDKLPPCVCRLFARRSGPKGWEPKSHREIADEIGIHKATVAWYSHKKTWGGIPIATADSFARACGVNLAEIDEVISRLRHHRTRLLHLSRGNGHQRRMIAALLAQTKTK